MELVQRIIPYKSRTDEITIWAIGDVHVGNIGFHREGFERTIRAVAADPRSVVVLMGDLAECIVPSDKRFDAGTVHPDFLSRLQDLPGAQYDYLERILTPIAPQIIGSLTGNHEETIRLRYYQATTHDLCRRLRISYLGYSAAINFKFRRPKGSGHTTSFTLYAHHGRGGGRSSGGQLNTIEKVSEGISARVYIMGHVHGLSNSVRSRMYFNFKSKPPRIEDHMQLFGITGSYLKTYIKGVTTYSEKAMYQPNSLGCLKVIVRPYDLQMRLERFVV